MRDLTPRQTVVSIGANKNHPDPDWPFLPDIQRS